MPTLGQVVTFLTNRGDLRVAHVSYINGSTTVSLHVFLLPGDDDWGKGAVFVYANVPQDTTGTTPFSWH